MVNQILLSKSNLGAFIRFLAAKQKVVGPVALGHGQFKFDVVTSLEEISLQYTPTILPPKKYYLPQYETLLRYDVTNGQKMEAIVEVEELVLFGIHTCDIAGIQCLNMVFSDRPKDPHYLIRKSHFTLIGLECNDYCDSYANCAMLGNHMPRGGYDLFFTELTDYYYIHVHTQRGNELVDESGLFDQMTTTAENELAELRALKNKIFKHEVPIDYEDIPRLFDETYESQVWEDVGNRCLSCGNCTNVCPTCYCFDVMDEPDLDLVKGRRVRVWDSCQNEVFAKVAGGESFRKDRKARKRHRFNRKFKYPMDRYHRIFCTGCGRCSRACMAKIDLKATIKALMKKRGDHENNLHQSHRI